mgnify:CR=1 FL=1
MTLLSAERISRRFGDQSVLKDISFTVVTGQRIGMVGRNGCGKTTLFDIVAERMGVDAGNINRARQCRVDYAEQELTPYLDLTLHEFVASARPELSEAGRELEELQHHLQDYPDDSRALEQLGQMQHEFEVSGGFGFEHQIKTIMHGLGFSADRHHDRLSNFSGGERNRAGLARVLAGNGNLLLLDEPTNHLDIESTRWLEEYLQQIDRAYIVVSHDRAFLQATVQHVWELVDGQLEFYTGGIDNYIRERSERRRLQQHHYRHQQEEIKRIEEFIRRNMAGQKTKQAQSKLKYLDRIKRLPPPKSLGPSPRISVSTSGRSYAHVLSVQDLTLSYGSEPLLDKTTFDLYRGDRVGLIGRNGSGKSTLLKALVGEMEPASGNICLGNKVDVAYFDQELVELNHEQTVMDSLWELDTRASMGEIRSFLAYFGFIGDDVLKVVGALSGGEKTKLSLARLLYHPANFIIFDEPTNHLDMDSREALEEALVGYEGTCLIVSHDRFFLDRVVNRILHLEAGGITAYDGNYSYFREKTEASGAPVTEVKPKKSKEAWLAFKKKSKERGRLKKDIKSTRGRIDELESRLHQLESDIARNIPRDDWEQLEAAARDKASTEDELLKLYARLEDLEEIDLD